MQQLSITVTQLPTSITIPSLARLLCVLPLRIACLLTMMGISARVSSKSANSAMTPYEPSMSTPRMSGWTDRNAILEFFARPAPTPRPAAVSQTAKCTPAIRPQKGYKEFKFYHYADPDAYIVQYRYDCSSVASRRCDDGPLEQFVVLNYKGEPISKSNAPGGAIRNNPDAPKSCSPWASFDNGSCVTPRTSLLNLLEPGGGEAATFLNSCPLLKGATKQPPVKKSDERLIQRPQVLNSTRSGRITAGRVPEQQVALQVNSQFSKSVRQLNQLTSAKCAIVPAPSKRGRRIHNTSSAVVGRSGISAITTLEPCIPLLQMAPQQTSTSLSKSKSKVQSLSTAVDKKPTEGRQKIVRDGSDPGFAMLLYDKLVHLKLAQVESSLGDDAYEDQDR
ncbi:hypothetical protein CSKR_111420 [Clonorchis sinensis]|uniref:Uncharacterized protein n=1 Tax=Clonorchis sinensis TaxID=79923 RepID=A0A8T1LXG1_CLOSI|nr:hypothetical protein CSKR_111420 [Clonorchis sinensis]